MKSSRGSTNFRRNTANRKEQSGKKKNDYGSQHTIGGGDYYSKEKVVVHIGHFCIGKLCPLW